MARAVHERPDAALNSRFDGADIDLRVGQSPYTSPRLLESLSQISADPAALRLSRYGDPLGFQKFRHEISARYQRLYGLPVDPDRQILITHGATEAVWLAILAITEPGDEIIIPDPSYMTFEPAVRALNRVPVRIPLRPEKRFRLGVPDLEGHISRRTSLLVLVSPDNPTGVVLTKAELSAIHQFVDANDLTLLHDEVYDEFVYDGRHVSSIEIDPDCRHTVVVNSLSKSRGIGGWRLGWLIADEKITTRALQHRANTTMAPSPLLQAAAAACVNDPDNIDRVREVRSRLRTTGNLFTAGLSGIDGITMPAGAPQGGFYLFADVSGYHENLPSPTPGESPGEHVANHLRSRRIHVGPGVGFGAAGRSYIRLAFTSPMDVLMEACERIAL